MKEPVTTPPFLARYILLFVLTGRVQILGVIYMMCWIHHIVLYSSSNLHHMQEGILTP